MNQPDTDSLMHQQSKRLAGLSITNSSGTKVSILNDNGADQASRLRDQDQQSEQSYPSEQRDPQTQSPPPSPRVRVSSASHEDEHLLRPHSHHHHRHHHHSRGHQSHHSHRNHYDDVGRHYRHYHQERPHETGRSSSLTNASTPIYSSQELQSSKNANSQRSRSLSGSASPSSVLSSSFGQDSNANDSSNSVASPTLPFFARSYSEENTSDDAELQRRQSDPSSSPQTSNSQPANVIKRKYSCTFPGCNKCFTTSGHLARHNRIHTGERNFACLMPGCPSKFSRQDNMMQHYRTHVSPKSRRGVPKSKEFKEYKEYYGLGNASQERLAHVSGGSRDQSPAASLTRRGSAELDAQIHFYNAAKIATARQGSRQNSPPRFNPLDRSGSVDYMGRSPSENHGSSVGGTLRHKHSGILQTHQHHTPLPHFNIQAVAMNHPSTQSPPSGPSSTLPSPLTPSIQQPAVYQQQQQQSGYLPAPHGAHAPSTKYLSETHGSYPSESVLASPTSPFTRDVERMEGVTPSYEHEPRHPHQAQQHYHHSYHHQSTQPSHPSSYPGHPQITPAYHTHPSQQHAGHASAGHLPSSTQHHHSSHPTSSHSAYQLPPLTIQGNRQDQGPTHSDSKSYSSSSASDPSSMYGNSNGNHRHGTKHAAPLSPQSTPHTPTKYRFDPIQDCLQQDKHSHPHHAYPRESHIGGDTRMRYDDEESGSTTRSSGISSMSSMTSISSASSSSMSIAGQQQQHRQHGQNIQMSGEARHDKPVKQENPEELSSLAHLAQIVTTYG